jgi:hypothetical protein
MELVVSCDGIPTGTSSGPELAAQADKIREVRKIADTAARRIRTRTQNNSRRQNPCRRKLPTWIANGELPKKVESNLYGSLSSELGRITG